MPDLTIEQIDKRIALKLSLIPAGVISADDLELSILRQLRAALVQIEADRRWMEKATALLERVQACEWVARGSDLRFDIDSILANKEKQRG
jgi:predicted negative regulator of RcsB-dependent stress response